MPIKVIQGRRFWYTNLKPVCDFLLVTNLHPISHRFQSFFADYWSNLRFRQGGSSIQHTRVDCGVNPLTYDNEIWPQKTRNIARSS